MVLANQHEKANDCERPKLRGRHVVWRTSSIKFVLRTSNRRTIRFRTRVHETAGALPWVPRIEYRMRRKARHSLSANGDSPSSSRRYVPYRADRTVVTGSRGRPIPPFTFTGVRPTTAAAIFHRRFIITVHDLPDSPGEDTLRRLLFRRTLSSGRCVLPLSMHWPVCCHLTCILNTKKRVNNIAQRN